MGSHAKSAVNFYFEPWADDGTFDDIHEALYGQVRDQAGRSAEPSRGIIDSQTSKDFQKRRVSIDL